MANRIIRALAPAKLNLFLHIRGRFENGYHDLQTLFRLLDHGDEMSFTARSDGRLTLHCSGPESAGLPMDSNLVLKAARRLRDLSGNETLGAKIELTKYLPHGAGLGGGSSDAATTLSALNRLWQLNLSLVDLCKLGAELGADVPVFLAGRTAWGEGIGDKLSPVELPHCWYLVVTPDCHVATEAIFSHQQLTRNSSTIKMADFLAGRSRNDCEFVTKLLYPEVGKAMKILEEFAKMRMTGTGSSIFAEFQTEAEAFAILEKLPKHLKGFVAKGVNSLEEMRIRP